MCASDSALQRDLLQRLLDDGLDEEAKLACLRALTLDQVDARLLAYAVDLFRGHMIEVDCGGCDPVDLCGTGGDKSGSFNISTTAALVVAGAGVPVAKHGNVSVTSRSGSIDLLRALGVSIPATPDEARTQMDRAGVMFLFAPHFHPAFRHFAAARRSLAAEGVRTIFNLLGPLLNPARARRAVMGVFAPGFVAPVADAMCQTGMNRALVFHGDGMDELTLTGTNVVSAVEGGQVTALRWEPEFFALPRCSGADLAGGTPDENAAIVRDLLVNGMTGPKRDMVVLNAAAALLVAGEGGLTDFSEARARAEESINNGAAARVLERLGA